MSEEAQKIGQRVGYAMLWPILLAFPVALFAGGITLKVFIATEALWVFLALVLILGPESIGEITIWKASIKRHAAAAEKDARAAREAKEEAEAIRNDLREVARLNIENTFVLNSLVSGLYGAPHREVPPALDHVARNLDALTPLISKDPNLVSAWQGQMRELLRRSPSEVEV